MLSKPPSTDIEKLKCVDVMLRSDGNWNYDPYLHGMANGVILALSVIEDKEPEYLDAPDKWLCDTPGCKRPSASLAGLL